MVEESNGTRYKRSRAAFMQAKASIPGGVNSPVRAFRAVGGDPVYFSRGEGPYVWDIDGNRYVDYMLSWGPLIAGHAHPRVVAAVQEQAAKGTSFGAPTLIETELAEAIKAIFPSMDLVRMVNSGTEATMSALRLARAYTGRSKIVKFEGCYHGHADSFLIRAGSGVATLSLPDSPGVPGDLAALTLTIPYNDVDALRLLFQEHGEDIAGVIVEAVAGNMGMVVPDHGYLQAVREITSAYDAVLIFDEVMTGFRVHLGGAQALFGITPDLTTLGKVIGGGLPVGAYGGRKEIMELVAPLGPVYQAGTLSGNPLAMAAGLETLRLIQEEGVYEGFTKKGQALTSAFQSFAKKRGIPVQTTQLGSMFGAFFASVPVRDYETAKKADAERYRKYFHAMLEAGVYLAPSQLESSFLSLAHDDEVIAFTIQAMEKAFQQLN